MSVRIWKFGVAAVVIAAVMAAAPAVAAPGDVTLYEVTENMKLSKRNERKAEAALIGVARSGSPICPAALGKDCTVTAFAQDSVSLATGLGPVHGRFAVVVHGDNPVDAEEFVVLRGRLVGSVDLSPAVLANVPLGSIAGRWYAAGVDGTPLAGFSTEGTFTGTFRLPFVLPNATTTPLYLLDPATFAVVPVADNERSLGAPTVRLEVDMVQGDVPGQFRKGNKQ